MKKLTIIVIPVIAMLLIVIGAFIWKVMFQVKPTGTTGSGSLPNSLNNASGTKPSNPFSVLFKGKATATPIPIPTPASAASLNADLQALTDDGGTSDFSSLQKTTSGL